MAKNVPAFTVDLTRLSNSHTVSFDPSRVSYFRQISGDDTHTEVGFVGTAYPGLYVSENCSAVAALILAEVKPASFVALSAGGISVYVNPTAVGYVEADGSNCALMMTAVGDALPISGTRASIVAALESV